MHGPPQRTASAAELGVTECAVAISECLGDGDIIHAADSEADARAIATALSVAAPDAHVILYPETDALPGGDAPASPANIGARNAALSRLRKLATAVDRSHVALVTTGEALADACPMPSQVDADPFTVCRGQSLKLDQLLSALTALGYIEDDRVDEPGEVALRGQVLDVFPAQSEHPVRVEATDGTITAISIYNLVDQRRIEETERFSAASVAEHALNEGGCAIPDHLPTARIVRSAAADKRRRNKLRLGSESAAAARRLVPDEGWRKAIAGRDVVDLSRPGDPPPRFVEEDQPEGVFAQTVQAGLDADDRVVLLGSERDLRFLVRRVEKLLAREVEHASRWSDIADASPGAVLALPMLCDRSFRRDGVLAIAATDLLGSRAERGDGIPAGLSVLPDQFAIRVGDLVVHEDHGIAVVAGIEPMPQIDDSATAGDAIKLVYAGDSVRLVPVTQAHKIWRYGADPGVVSLDRLDGSSWQKRKDDVKVAVAAAAQGLADVLKAREGQQAPVLLGDPAEYERFAADFPFAETPDQTRAIADVRDDLASGKPMDRLIIGDVGYGKTEIALRAAAIAVLEGRQVAVASPTTVLAQQHLDTFRRRFAPFGIRVGALHRLSSAAEKKATKQGLADGSIGIVIGTGAVAGNGVAYADLALVVIDEEQRFGTADKRKLRDMAAGHVLSLTATPIPRSLQSALVGLQQMSVLATPPARRQPIRTSVGPFDKDHLRAALLRERARRGQSFVVVPKIQDMAGMAAQLHELLPDFELLEAHGKLPAAEIDETMMRFAQGYGDVLLATNIIEAGLDVARANTMIVCNADRFGLAQLHQMRGRVGRGNLRGQMLMFTEAGKDIPERTLKRLQTLEGLNQLGAGFEISARDLDMRGAGDLLGAAQTGHMKLIGVELYQHLLAQALAHTHGRGAESWTPEIRLDVEGRLPQDWIADQETRLEIYMRLARTDGTESVGLFRAELEDRFGAIPKDAETLLKLAEIRATTKAAQIAEVAAGPAGITLRPRDDAVLNADGLGLKQRDGLLVLAADLQDPACRLDRAADLVAAVGLDTTGQ